MGRKKVSVLFYLGLWAAMGLVYLSNAHQRLLALPLPARGARMGAAGLASLALAGGWQTMGAAVTCFGGLAWTLLWAGLWPLAGTLLSLVHDGQWGGLEP